MDTIFKSEEIARIQTDELSEISGLTLEEISERIDMFQRTSRELYLRIRTAAPILHERLSALNDAELNARIHKVPMASVESNARRVKRASVKKVSASELIQRKAEKLSRQNPEIAALLASLKVK